MRVGKVPSEMKKGQSANVVYFLSSDYSGKKAGKPWRPNTDIFETDSHVVVAMEVAGVRPEDLEILEQHDRLTIRGVRRPAMSDTPRRFQQIEIVCGEFEKDVILSRQLHGAPVEATLCLGVLYVRIEKTGGAGSRVARRIEIEAE